MEKLFYLSYVSNYGTPYAPTIISDDDVYLDNCPCCNSYRFNYDNRDLTLILEICPTDYCPTCGRMMDEHGVDCSGFEIKMPDYLLCGHYPLNIVSEAVIDAWKKHNVTGYEAFPIKKLITHDSGIDTNVKYFNLLLTGYAELDFEKMGISIVSECSRCGAVRYSNDTWEFGKAHIKPNTYDGSDVFMVKNCPNIICCTEKILEITRKECLTNFIHKSFASKFMH